MADFQMPFVNSDFERAAHLRTDADYLEKAMASRDVQIFVLRGGEPFCFTRPGGDEVEGLGWFGPEVFELFDKRPFAMFMGLDKQDFPIFGLEASADFDPQDTKLAGAGDFMDMRAIAGLMSPGALNLIGTAKGLVEWHTRNNYCGVCGEASAPMDAGWKRECRNCGTEHFPRIDPVSIMLAVKGEKCLMGRQKGWPENMYSCLAGFIEPGETFEDAARRELKEEAGIIGGEARYLFCQPWPFPGSLMIGIIVEALSEDIDVDGDELEEARWFTKEEANAMLAGGHASAWAPPPLAVAHHILKAWAEEG